MQETPCARKESRILSRLSASVSVRAAVGSSRIRTRASLVSALAISTNCCDPTPRSMIREAGLSLRPTSLRTWNVTFSSARTPGNSLVMFLISSRYSLMVFPCTPPARAGGEGCCRLLLIDLRLLQVAALDQHVVEVLFGDDDGREQHRRHVLLVVVHHLAAEIGRAHV